MRRRSVEGGELELRDVPSEVVEELGAVAEVRWCERQRVEVVPDAEAVGDRAVRVDRPERREAVRVVTQEVEQVRPVAMVPDANVERVEVVPDAEAVGDRCRSVSIVPNVEKPFASWRRK